MSMPIDPSDMPKTSLPEGRDVKIGEHTQEQAETLLSEPIMIPRNPISINVRMLVIMFFGDLVLAVVLALLLGGLAVGGARLSASIIIFVVTLLAIKFTLLMLILAKMATNWSEMAYYITDRAIIVRRGIANVAENTYELSNIRHVYMFQDFVGRMYDYGHLQLVIATMGLEETVRISDIKNPSHYTTLFEKYLG